MEVQIHFLVRYYPVYVHINLDLPAYLKTDIISRNRNFRLNHLDEFKFISVFISSFIRILLVARLENGESLILRFRVEAIKMCVPAAVAEKVWNISTNLILKNLGRWSTENGPNLTSSPKE